MAKIKAFFKNLKWSHVLLAVAYILFGLALLFMVSTIKAKIADIIGLVLVIIGRVHITQYFLQEMEESYFGNNFMEGVILVLLGILCIYQNAQVMVLVPYMLAIAVIGSGVSKLQDAIDAKRMGDTHSAVFLVLAVISLIVGCLVMFNIISGENNIYMVLGGGMLYSGITDLVAAIYLSNRYGKFLRGEIPAAKEEPKPEEAPKAEEPAPTAAPETPVLPDPVVPEAPIAPEEPAAPAETPEAEPAAPEAPEDPAETENK